MSSFLPGTPGTLETPYEPYTLTVKLDAEDYVIWPTLMPWPSFEQIVATACYIVEASEENFYLERGQRSRTSEAVLARQLAASLCKRIRGMSTTECRDAIRTQTHSTFTSRSSWAARFMHGPGGIALYNTAIRVLIKEQKHKHPAKGEPTK